MGMDLFEKRKLKLYGIFWGAVLIVPTLPLLWGALGITGHFSSFEEVFSLWLSILPILVLFLLHNFLVLPLFKKNKPVYTVSVLALVVLFGIFCFTIADTSCLFVLTYLVIDLNHFNHQIKVSFSSFHLLYASGMHFPHGLYPAATAISSFKKNTLCRTY